MNRQEGSEIKREFFSGHCIADLVKLVEDQPSLCGMCMGYGEVSEDRPAPIGYEVVPCPQCGGGE